MRQGEKSDDISDSRRSDALTAQKVREATVDEAERDDCVRGDKKAEEPRAVVRSGLKVRVDRRRQRHEPKPIMGLGFHFETEAAPYRMWDSMAILG